MRGQALGREGLAASALHAEALALLARALQREAEARGASLPPGPPLERAAAATVRAASHAARAADRGGAPASAGAHAAYAALAGALAALGRALLSGTLPGEPPRVLGADGAALAVVRLPRGTAGGATLAAGGRARVRLPARLPALSADLDVQLAAWRGAGWTLDATADAAVASDVVSVSLFEGAAPLDPRRLGSPAVVGLPVASAAPGARRAGGALATCQHWNAAAAPAWSGAGCLAVSANASFAECACTHTTNLAAVVRAPRAGVSAAQELPSTRIVAAQAPESSLVLALTLSAIAAAIVLAAAAACADSVQVRQGPARLRRGPRAGRARRSPPSDAAQPPAPCISYIHFSLLV